MNRLPGLVQCKYNNFISKIINKESFIMWYYSKKCVNSSFYLCIWKQKRRLATAYYQRLQVFLYFTKRFQQISIKNYLITPCSWNIFFRISTPRSTCSFVWVAISANLTSVSCGAQAGGITGLMNTPAS